MEDDIDMAQHGLTNLKDPVNNNDAANKKYVVHSILLNNNNYIDVKIDEKIEEKMDDKIDEKIKESEEKSIQSVNQENVFKKVMDDDEFKEDDNDIHKVGTTNKNFHLVNKKTYEFKIDYDSSIGYYSTRLSIDLIYLPINSYTMVYEMYVDDGITIDEIDARSGTLSVG